MAFYCLVCAKNLALPPPRCYSQVLLFEGRMRLDVTLFGISVTNDPSLDPSFHWPMQHGEVFIFVIPSLVINSSAFIQRNVSCQLFGDPRYSFTRKTKQIDSFLLFTRFQNNELVTGHLPKVIKEFPFQASLQTVVPCIAGFIL